MPRPVKWSRDLHPIRERAKRSRTETWSRKDIQDLFNVGPSSAQNLLKAIGEVQAVGGTHFVERSALLAFLDEMVVAESVETALRNRLLQAEAPPAPRPLLITLPPDLRNVMVRDLPDTIRLSPGRLEIQAVDTESILEGLALLARALQNDLAGAQAIWDPAPVADRPAEDWEINALLASLRSNRSATS